MRCPLFHASGVGDGFGKKRFRVGKSADVFVGMAESGGGAGSSNICWGRPKGVLDARSGPECGRALDWAEGRPAGEPRMRRSHGKWERIVAEPGLVAGRPERVNGLLSPAGVGTVRESNTVGAEQFATVLVRVESRRDRSFG